MGNVLKEVSYKMPGRLFCFNILLATDMAVLAVNLCIAVKAIFFFSFFKMAQAQ